MTIPVLIIEDDFRIGNIHQEMIEQVESFHVVHSVLTAKDAIDFLHHADSLPELIVLDIYIPDVDKLSLLETLRTTYPYIPIIIITAANDTETIQSAKYLGVFDYLIKPIDKKRLHDSLQQLKKERSLPEKEWTQDEVDKLFRGIKKQRLSQTEKINQLPKGIDQLTLQRIMNYISTSQDRSITAQDLAEQIGVSRSTARRYLEYLDTTNTVEATVHYGQVGRPQRLYIIHE